MPVVNVGVVRMGVDQRLMDMRVGVRFAPVPREIVRMLMVLIVEMRMRVFLSVVSVQVGMVLSDVQPDSHCHQQACCNELPGYGLALQKNREYRPKERSNRKVRSGSCRAEVA